MSPLEKPAQRAVLGSPRELRREPAGHSNRQEQGCRRRASPGESPPADPRALSLRERLVPALGVPRGRAPGGARQRERASRVGGAPQPTAATHAHSAARPGGVSERARPRPRLACVSPLPWCPARRVDFKSCGQWGAAARGNGPGAAFESRPEPPTSRAQPGPAAPRHPHSDPAQPPPLGTHRSRGTGTRCCCFGAPTLHPPLHRHQDPPLPRHRDLPLPLSQAPLSRAPLSRRSPSAARHGLAMNAPGGKAARPAAAAEPARAAVPAAGKEVPKVLVDPRTQRSFVRGRFLGKGGFARCYELAEAESREVFAGKVVPKSLLVKPHQKEKMSMEIAIHRSLSHRHVVGFQGFFEDDDFVYVVLELCRRRVRTGGRVSVSPGYCLSPSPRPPPRY